MPKITQKITTFLWFDANAEEAVKFYTSIFKDSRINAITRVPEGGPGAAGSVLVVDFQLEGQQFAALNGGPRNKFTEAISLVVHCADQAEVDDYWERLLAGGGKTDACGWLKDRFGLSWQVTPDVLLEMIRDPDNARAGRVMQAMMQMVKLDIAALQRAYDGT